MTTTVKESKVGKYVTIGAAVVVVLSMAKNATTPSEPTNTDPKVFVSCEASRKAIASEDKRLTSYMDSEAELETEVGFGRRAYTSTTFHDQANILIGREDAREKLKQLNQTARDHGCPR